MKFYLSALFATAIFVVSASLTLDAVTYLLGKPSRGVSYGIAIHYLNYAIAIVGLAALRSTKWIKRDLSMAFGAIALCVCVIGLFPQPGIGVRILVALAISMMLALSIAIHAKINR